MSILNFCNLYLIEVKLVFSRLKMATQRLDLEEDELVETLVDVLRRYIYYIEEREIEIDIRREENINQFHLLNNYSTSMTDILKSVSVNIINSSPND